MKMFQISGPLRGPLVTAVITLAVTSAFAADLATPVALSGWNADVVLENSPSRSATFFDMNYGEWFEAGLGGHNDGLPASRQVLSTLTPGVLFELQHYDGPNVLQLFATNETSSLNLPQPAPFRRLYILAASGNGGGTGTLVLAFTDGSNSQAMPFYAPDWWDGTRDPAPRRPALKGLARSIGGGPDLDYQFSPPGFSLHQTDIDFSALGFESKVLSKIIFTKPRAFPAPYSTSIFAVSGELAPVVGPSIITEPQNQIVAIGAAVSFTVIAAGTGLLEYQWRKDGLNLNGETNTTFTLTNVTLSANGSYSVVVSNAVDRVTSSNALLMVIAPPTLTASQLALQPNGSTTLNLTVPVGVRVVVEASSDLVNWETLTDEIASSSSLNVKDPVTISDSRFYRIKYFLL